MLATVVFLPALAVAPTTPGTATARMTASTAPVPSWYNLSAQPTAHAGLTDCPTDRLAWDASDGYVLTYGGRYNKSIVCSYVAGRWSILNVTGNTPGSRGYTAFASDTEDGSVLLFGGAATQVNLSSGWSGLYNDTWRYRGGAWTQLHPSTSPPNVNDASMAYDAADGYMVLFGGFLSNATNGPSYFGETWIFDGGNWSQLHPVASPPPRASASMAYDARDGEIVLFGGMGGNIGVPTLLNDTWRFRAGTWTRVTSPVGPAARYSAGLAYDPEVGATILYGGIAPHWCTGGPCDGTAFQDTWAYTAGTWTQLVPPASPTPGITLMDYDALDGSVVALQTTWWYYGVPFVANVTSTPSPATVGSAVAFSVQIGGGTPPYTYLWWFGDGARSTDPAPTHSYAAPGTFHASVQVTDSLGARTNHSFAVQVSDVFFGLGWSGIAALAIGAAVVVAALVWLLRRRRQGPPSEKPPAERPP